MRVIEKSLTLLTIVAVYAVVLYSYKSSFLDNVTALREENQTELLTLIDPSYLLEDDIESNESSIVTAQANDYPAEIEAMLEATPYGSEIYLEEKTDGEVYLRIELTVPAPTEEVHVESEREVAQEEIMLDIPIEETMLI